MNIDAISLFTLPTKVLYGYNCVNRAGAEAKKLGIKKILVVTDKAIKDAGVVDPLLKNLNDTGVPYEVFDEAPVDPDTAIVDKGVEMLKRTACDGVAIVGGGSALCAGKGIALVATNGGNIRDYEGVEKYRVSPLPVIGIPTTAGSGSEVSSSFIIADEQRKSYKFSVSGYACHPNVAILDPMLLRSLPARQFALSGMDALSHAVEAICTNQGTPLTDAIAYQGIELIMKNLATASLTDDLEAKGNQLFGSAVANIACGNAKLGLAHAMATPLGSFHVPHGLANAILLPYVMEFNWPACEQKLATMAEVIGVTTTKMTVTQKAVAAVDAVKDLTTKLDIPDRLTDEMAPKSEIPWMSEITLTRQHVKTNIRKASKKDIEGIFERTYRGWR